MEDNLNEISSIDKALFDLQRRTDRWELLKAPISTYSCYNQSQKCIWVGSLGSYIANILNFASLKQYYGWKHCGDTKKKDEFKNIKGNSIPCFTLTSWVEVGKSNSEAKEVKNPYIIIDIDKDYGCSIDSDEFRLINSLPFVLGSSLSCSGCGYWSIVEFYSDNVTSKNFKLLFNELYQYYQDLGIEIDDNCKNVNRLRVCSPYDFVWNNNYNKPYEPILFEEPKQFTPIKDAYELADNTHLIKEPYIEGKMFTKRIGWANTLFNCFGEDGWNIYLDILSEDRCKLEELQSYWNQARKGTYNSNPRFIKILKSSGYIKDEDEDNNQKIDKMFQW